MEAELIFPEEPEKALPDGIEYNSVPNRFVGFFKKTPDPQVGEKIKKAVQGHFRKIADAEILIKHGKAPFDEYEHQINNHLEIFWLIFPYSEYTKEVYRDAERFFSGT